MVPRAESNHGRGPPDPALQNGDGASWYTSSTTNGQESNQADAKWIGWVEESIDFFTCDEEVGKRVLEKALSLHQTAIKPPAPPVIDYAAQHDQFLESLLQVQTTTLPSNLADDLAMLRPSLSMSSSQSFASSQTSSVHSRAAEMDDLKSFSMSRPLKLHRRKSKGARVMERDEKPLRGSSPRKIVPLMERADSPVTVCLEDLEKANLPAPSTYMHPQCCLQKDKGKGEAVGSKLCAQNAEECLAKLLQKMELLTSVTLGKDEKGKKGNAEMKRKNAKIAEETATFTETRSMIVLRMGFLSMQYGVLLRWDNRVTGKITMVVLRKLCHDSFYPKSKVTTTTTSATKPAEQQQQPRPTHDVVFENHAILDRPHGLEVALFEPPFLVPQPHEFAPALLTVMVECAKGLSSRLAWTVKLHLADKTEKVNMRWNPSTSMFEPLSEEVMEWQIPALAFWDMKLEVELYEQKRLTRRAHRRKIWMATMPLSLASLQARTPVESQHPVKIHLKVPSMPGASIVLSMSYQSDYAGWIFRELEARRKEEAKFNILMSPLSTRRVVMSVENDEVEHEYPMWDLFCCAC